MIRALMTIVAIMLGCNGVMAMLANAPDLATASVVLGAAAFLSLPYIKDVPGN